jgi:hypothetical protein
MTQPRVSLDTIRVSKKELLTKLKENRDIHKTSFVEIHKGYKAKVVEKLTDALQLATDDKEYITNLGIYEPSHHLSDYDTAIGMLTMSLDDEIILTRSEFLNYIEDKWDWKSSYLAVSGVYTVSS